MEGGVVKSKWAGGGSGTLELQDIFSNMHAYMHRSITRSDFLFYFYFFGGRGGRAAAACQKTSGSPVLSFFLIFLTKTLKYRDKRLLVFNTSETNGGLIVGCPPDASATAGLVVFASMRLTGSSEYCPSIAEHWCCPEHRNCTPV